MSNAGRSLRQYEARQALTKSRREIIVEVASPSLECAFDERKGGAIIQHRHNSWLNLEIRVESGEWADGSGRSGTWNGTKEQLEEILEGTFG